MNEERFLEYVEDTLLPHLCPYEGEHSPLGSVFVLDNAKHHWSDEVIAKIRSTGCVLIFLPPYSPDLNPIEVGFNLLKTRMKRLRNPRDFSPLFGEIFRALNVCCDRGQSIGCFRKCGLVVEDSDEELLLLLMLSYFIFDN